MYRSKIGEGGYTYKGKKISIKRTYIPREVTHILNLKKGELLIWRIVKEGILITKEDGIKEIETE